MPQTVRSTEPRERPQAKRSRPAGVTTLFPRDATATRARILAAALGEFAARGMDARVEDIADLAGANRRMAYYYFGSKEGLYLAALEAAYLELAAVERAIDVDALDPPAAIATLIAAKFDHYVRYPHYVEFLKIENMNQARFLKESKRLDEVQAPLLHVLGRVLERGRASGVFRRDVDAVELYTSICALGYFVFSNRYTLHAIFDADPTSPAALARREAMVVEMITTFLLTPAAREAASASPRNAARGPDRARRGAAASRRKERPKA